MQMTSLFNFLKKPFRTQQGIALLMVLSTLALLTTLMVEFSYSSRIQYRLAVQGKERLQAYYLAQSSLRFAKLLLKYNKQAESMLNQAGSAAANLQIEPFYKMFPLSSELIRGLVSGELQGLLEEKDSEEKENTVDSLFEDQKKKATSDLQSGTSLFEKEEAEKFLSFEGNFAVEITEEQTKLNLNSFYGLETSSPRYDQLKKMLVALLLSPDFKELFEDPIQDPPKLAHALADWVDANDVQNEYDNVQRGAEKSQYSDVKYDVKNAKYLTFSELRLVSGMNDALYSKLQEYVTVYGRSGSDKMNFCLGPEEWLKALIYHFTQNADCTRGIDYRDEKKMDDLVEKVRAACPDANQMVAVLNSELGLQSSAIGAGAGEAIPGQGAIAGCKFQLGDLMTQDNLIFTVKGSGTVGETTVNLTVVWNIQESDPRRWKQYYYRMQ